MRSAEVTRLDLTERTPRAFSRAWIEEVRRALLAFYDARRRDLPWRRDRDPYGIWVSEVMLQQTRAETVIPYYLRWLERFPTVEALACAPLDDVLKAWEGLGYYSRARNLHRAARAVHERHAGRLPADPDALRALPGIGAYTAGAIASIAFDLLEPAVDGNVRRVLARLMDAPAPDAAQLRARARRLVPPDRPGDFNQALMELGAMVCTPRDPACRSCPLRALCRARARGTQQLRPRPRARSSIPEFDVGTAVIRARDGRLLLTRRPPRGLLAGLWEFPGRIAHGSETVLAAATAAAAAWLGDAGFTPGVALATIAHAFTHRRETYHAFRFDVLAPAAPEPPLDAGRAETEAVWVEPAALTELTLPAAQRRIAGYALAQEG